MACRPRPIEFAESAPATLGVEWEFALVDKHSRDLVNAASELFDLVAERHGEQPRVHKELLRNTVELTTGICRTTSEAIDELAGLIAMVRPLAPSSASTCTARAPTPSPSGPTSC